MNEELLDCIAQIVQMLLVCGYPDESSWLAAKSALLVASAGDPLVQAKVTAEIHGVTRGMGGLFDLQLHPSEESELTAPRAREELDRLAENLGRLT